ncbi:MAG TPA: molybdopterin-dependent oxidoreductase [Desulfomonilaceae bacterium]|nr:molybdopterin-dependent oxidoreductase [Desulfomonilaceae bacterium]
MKLKEAPNVIGVETRGRRTVFSLCGMCAVRCPIQVEVDDGRIIWLQGNPNDKAMGSSLCAKGSAGVAFEYDDERPQYPLIRTGARGAGHWRRAGWDEALDYVANGLKEVMRQYGGKGIVLSDRGGPFSDLTKSFVKALASPNYFDHDCTCGRNAHHATRSLFGVGRTGLAYDIKNTKHIVLYGRNIIEALQVKEAKEFIEALNKRAKCTYIDPRGSLTATKAGRFWQIRPGTDYALNLAMINLVLAQDMYDKEFVSRWVIGLDELRAFVADKTPEWQEQYTGISAADVRSFVREISQDAPHVIFHAGWMTARYNQSFYASRTAHILNALFGAIEAPGGLIFSKGAGDAGKKGLKKISDRIPEVTDKRVDGCGWKYPHFDGGSGLLHLLFSAINSGKPYPIAAYIAYRHDPLTAMPDPDAVKQALDKLKLLVSIDVNYSETGWYSDVILPESSYLERANILAEKSGPKPSLHMRDQAVVPRFDSRPAWWIFCELAKRLDIGQYFDFESIEEIWNYQLEGTGVTVAQMRDKGVFSLVDKPILWDRTSGLKFKTPSGKIEFRSSILEKAGLPSFAEFAPPKGFSGDEFRLLFGRAAVHTHGQTMNNPLLNELLSENPVWIHPDRAAELGIEDGDSVEVSNQGYSVLSRAKVTPWIHPEAVFMLHGFGRTVPLQTRAYARGVADQRLQKGLLTTYDPAGGGNTLCECTVRVSPAGKDRSTTL